jgi:hypothetical protein
VIRRASRTYDANLIASPQPLQYYQAGGKGFSFSGELGQDEKVPTSASDVECTSARESSKRMVQKQKAWTGSSTPELQ